MLGCTNSRAVLALVTLLGALLTAGAAQAQGGAAERLVFAREHRGTPIEVPGQLFLPPGTGKVPAMIVHHGSGGVREARELRYARELVGMGVAALVIDSFTPRGIKTTVTDQEVVSAREMAHDAFAALAALSAHSRIDPARIGIVGFSKGGTVAVDTAHERAAVGSAAGPRRFALHVAFYPSCAYHPSRPRVSKAPIYMLVGGADTYAGVAPCTEYAAKLKAAGAAIELRVYPDAPHGFDEAAAYRTANGQNWSRCVFEEQTDGTWKERTSGETTIGPGGRRIEEGFRRALAKCRTLGVSGGPNAAAKGASMAELKSAVRRHLIEAR
jgi:dienelactone hydrolase